MHPEMNYRIAQLRHQEMLSARRTTVASRRTRRRFFRRRRDTPVAVDVQPASIVLLPPPREALDTTGHDQRVA